MGMDEKMDLSEEEFLLYPYRLQSERELKEIDREQIERRFFDELKSLSEEAMQLAEFLSEDERLCHELCSLLRESLGKLDMAIEMPVRAFPFLERAERIMLNPRCHLIVLYEDGRIDSKALEDYPPEVVLMVFWNAMPKFRTLLGEYKEKVKRRVEYFDRISRDLKSLQGAFGLPQEEEIPVEGLYQAERTDATFFKT